MNNSTPNRMKNDKRRPAGISRRRKKQFGFETLEARQVMSAQSPVAALQDYSLRTSAFQVTSYSSNTLEGQLAILQNELNRYQTSDQAAVAYSTRAIPTDPLLGNQWHLINSGQQVGNPDFQSIFATAGEDINVAPVWEMGYTGAGVRVAIIDSGVQLDHPDLAANIHPTLRFDALEPDGNPTPEADFIDPFLGILRIGENAHGTGIAGIIGAVANNGIGGTGVAYGVDLVPIRLIDSRFGDVAFPFAVVNSFQYATNNGIDITNNSWGGNPVVGGLLSRGLVQPTQVEFDALRDSIFFGRDLDGPGGNPALGIIHVFAAGNEADTLREIAGYDGFVNSRYVIGVTSADHDGFYNNIDGTVTGFAEISAAVLVAAPSGSVALGITNDTFLGSGIVTTDTTDDTRASGFNVGPDPENGLEYDRDFLADPNYTSRLNGTSASAAMVTGVVALMLEANPNLSWRDVQEILVRSARQNAPLGEGANGADKAFSQAFSNTWITNQLPLFHDPDPWDPAINAVLQTQAPILDPNVTFQTSPGNGTGVFGLQNHYAAAPAQMTNGAGYTVSMGFGTNNEWFGYGHGVVDAELAVKLAEQWHIKEQVLPAELTFTTAVNTFSTGFVPRAQNTGETRGDYVVPGGIGGDPGTWIDYYQEYFDFDDDMQFMGDQLQGLLQEQRSAGPIELQVPDDGNTMVIESIEVSMNIDNWAEALNHLRIVLVSPSGTQSELNQFSPAGEFTDDFVQIDASALVGVNLVSPSNIPPLVYGAEDSVDSGTPRFTFSTKRHWGERSDNGVLYNASTGDPWIDTDVGLDAVFNPGEAPQIGDLLQRGWQLHFENWGDTDLNVTGIEITFHGRPIAANSERIQGFVGIDDNQNDDFNFSRVIRDTATETLFDSFDPTELRLGDVVTMADPNQEGFASNVIVTARRVSDGAVVDQFVTGADGNWYFDLAPDEYIISIEDPLDRLPKDDSLTPAGQLRHFQSEWHITEDWFRAWDADPFQVTETLVDATGTPVSFLDANGNTTVAGMKNINFLLDPGPPILQQAEFTGTIYADTNGDGVFNGVDVNLPNVLVFGDVNRNGLRDPGEATAITNANGQYTLTVPVTQAGVVNVGVVRPFNWTSTGDLPGTTDVATDGIESFFVRPGDSVGNIVFAVKPPANNLGGGGQAQPGILLGFVYDDANNNQSRQAGEAGAANVTVYIDANNNSVVDLGDTVTTTNANGAYVFTNVAPGTKVIRAIVNSPLVQTTPAPGTGRIVTLTGSSTISDIQFGVKNQATLDFGDLPANYFDPANPTNHARHTKGGYWLGQRVDAELAPNPSVNADGDDLLAPFDDEDGITFDPIVPGSTTRIVVTASTSGGVLQGWVDWNNDGDFNDLGERIITDKFLNAGVNQVFFSVPAGANVAQVYARFRYGENSLGFRPIGTPFGLAALGEVEDYRLNVAVPALPQVQGLAADADQDGDVDGNDFLNWQRNVGKTTGATQAQGDSNGDDAVNGFDLIEWRHSFGDVAATAAAAQAAMAPLSTGNDEDLATLGLALTPAIAPNDLDVQALTSTVSVSANGVTADGGLSPAVARRSSAEISRRPAFDLASALASPAASLRERFAALQDEADDAVAAAAGAWDVAAGDYLHQDRAFDDLLGSRRRQGLRVDGDAEVVDATEQCDEAFALLADHLEWPRG
jgi:subtilisin family serine protease